MTKPSKSNSAQLWTFNLATLSMMSLSAAAVMSENFLSLSLFGCLSSECMQRLSFVHNGLTQESCKVELLRFIVDFSFRMKSFPGGSKHKAPADMHKEAWALWPPSFKHYDVIVGWIPARPASCHSDSHTSIFCIWVVLLELLECCYFPPAL